MRKIMMIACLLMMSKITFSQDIKTHAVKINVTNLTKANEFYCGKLGFKVQSETEHYVMLQSADTKLILKKVPHFLPEGDKDAKAGLTLQVNDLDKTIASLKSKGLSFDGVQKRKEGVGYAIYVQDPFGKRISLMHQTITNVAPFDEPRIYNYGFLVPDMNVALNFYSNTLGFVQRSQTYMPLDMPLGHQDNTFAFMLHFREGVQSVRHNSPDNQHIVIVFQTTNLDKTIQLLKSKGIEFLQQRPYDSPLGKCISFYDPFGYLSEIIETHP